MCFLKVSYEIDLFGGGGGGGGGARGVSLPNSLRKHRIMNNTTKSESSGRAPKKFT